MYILSLSRASAISVHSAFLNLFSMHLAEKQSIALQPANRPDWDASLVRDPDKELNDQLTMAEIDLLCQHLPKVELHCHLSGSVLESTLRELCVANGLDPCTARFHLQSVSANDSYEKTWHETVEAFETIRKLTATDVQVLRRIATEAVQMHAADGCVYYELRTGLKQLPDRFVSVFIL
jgi:hypothetical protein